MPLFHKLNLLTLNDVFELEISKLIHNIENNKHFSDHISKNFERVNSKHSYNTSHSNTRNFVITENSYGNGEKSIVYLGPKTWQKIPTDIKSKVLPLFKKKYA